MKLSGVGYITPENEVTASGFKIDTSVSIPTTPGEAQRQAMAKRYGPEWEQGAKNLHSSDHDAALRKLWYRGQAGVGTGGLLKNDGKDHDGNPTIEEVYDSYFGTKGLVLETAHTVLPGEYGYGSTPLSPSPRQELWTTGFWRIYVGQWGAGRHLPKAMKAEIIRQCDLIESGVIPGWKPAVMGGMIRVV